MQLMGFDLHAARPTLVDVEQYRLAAMRKLPRLVQAYVDGAAESETTLRSNRRAFDSWSLNSRTLTGNSTHNLTTQVAGASLSLPVLLGPTGFAGLSHWKADVAAARAARHAGTRYITSTLSSWSIEEIAADAGPGQFFQLYPRHGSVAADLMKRAWDAGNQALFITVDVPAKGNRIREQLVGMDFPPKLSPASLVDLALHPTWTWNVLRHNRIGGKNLVDSRGLSAALKSIEIQDEAFTQATLSWDDVARMRETWQGKLYVKGILHPDDAKRAIAIGANGVVVSNHGGRQLDYAPASLDVLPDVVDAVGKEAEVLLDSGVRSGTDVIKALCLGANAVLIGRPYLYGLAVAGQRGVADILRILRNEIEGALTLMGVGDLAELDRTWLTPTTPVRRVI